jgi:hypothetical protein
VLELAQQSLGNVGRNVAAPGTFADLGGKPPRNSGRQLFGAGRLAHALILPMVGSLYWASLMTPLDRRREYGMGFWKNLRAGAAFMRDYQQDAMQTLPRWARVLRVGRGAFGMVSVDVEIHSGRTPPHVESVLVSVPRGAQLQIGQDMFVVGPDTSSDSNHTSWVIDVTRPPQYGSWPTPPGFRESRLKILQVHLRQGTITQEGYEQHLLEMGLDDDQGLLPNVPMLLRKLSCQASTTRPWGVPSAGHQRRAAVLRRRARFLPGSGRRAVSPGGAGRGSHRPGRSRPP